MNTSIYVLVVVLEIIEIFFGSAMIAVIPMILITLMLFLIDLFVTIVNIELGVSQATISTRMDKK